MKWHSFSPLIKALAFGVLIFIGSCKDNKADVVDTDEVEIWVPYNDSADVAANQDHEISRMRYKLIQSKVQDKNDIFLPLYKEVKQLSLQSYEEFKPLILEQNIPQIQASIDEGKLTYENLVLFYLHRMYEFELNGTTTLNTIVALNNDVLEQARKLDKEHTKDMQHHALYGMPILLKDNIGASGMPTTAGAIALADNYAADAFIVERLKSKGALLLGKVNLSEWAYFLCKGCPVGYSAIGGQTLNPYGRRIFETGGSSSGSGTAVAANYAVAAIGTETSGSILSPSSQNSVVGLKPTIGVLSRGGIVPISSTLDTPGPMTKNVVDNMIVLDAMLGKDNKDSASVAVDYTTDWYTSLQNTTLKGKRFGVFKNLMEEDSLYGSAIATLEEAGAVIVPFEPKNVDMNGFLSILNIDMKNDLPIYIKDNVQNDSKVTVGNIADVINFNKQDSVVRIPYGQALFEGIMADSTTAVGLEEIKSRLENSGRSYFDEALDTHQLDAVLSINNYHAGYAAVAKYPALTIPMGYREDGEPVSLTFIAKSFQEQKLYELGSAYEAVSKERRMPKGFE